MRVTALKSMTLVGLCIAAAMATTIALIRGGGDLALALMASVVIGAYLIARVPGNSVGWVLVVFGCAGVLSDLAEALLAEWQTSGSPARVPARAAAVLGASVFPLVGAMGTTLLLTFPTGRARGRWQWVLGGILAAGTIGVVSGLVWAISQPVDVVAADVLTRGESQNPAGIPASMTFVPGMPLSLVALGMRYRSASTVERLQIRWLGLAAAVVLTLAIAVNVINRFGGILDLLSTHSLALLPVAVAVAVTRYRLYDIDRIIGRVVTYTMVALALAGVFTLLAVLPAVVIGSAEVPPSLVAVSTLVVFALFNPLRRRVQRGVDRRFARLPYERESVLAEMQRRVHDEIDIQELGQSLHRVTEQALSPTRASVWTRDQP